jgi:hypothetical protein
MFCVRVVLMASCGLNSAGATPYSLHNLDAPSGYEAKEFHLQQVHKALPDKVSMHMPQLQLGS